MTILAHIKQKEGNQSRKMGANIALPRAQFSL
jgi:hypothetical protein